MFMKRRLAQLLLLSSVGLGNVAFPLFGQSDSPSARVRALSGGLLGLDGQLAQATPGSAALIRGEAALVIQQRAAALNELANRDPKSALSLVFSPDLISELTARFPQSASWLEAHGTWQGLIERSIVDNEDLRSSRSVHQLHSDTETLDIQFAYGEPGGLTSGDSLTVSGVRIGNTLIASDSTSLSTTALTCSATGVQNTIVLLVTVPGVPVPIDVTPQSVYDIFFGSSGTSVDSFWREASYGQTSAAGDVRGWYSLPNNYTCSQLAQLRDAAIAAASADGVVFQNYTRLFLVYPDLGCGWSGFAVMGCTSLNSPAGLFTASTTHLNARYMTSHDQGVELATHEGGHNFGLQHASSRDFGTEALGPLGVAGAVTDYGDKFSTLGSWNLGHYAAPQKAKLLNWMASGTNYLTVQNNGAYTLQPFEDGPAGLQAVKVQRGTGNDAWLWIEYRQPHGLYDSTLSSQIFSGATVHYEDSSTGAFSQLLDFTPQTDSWLDPALAAGRSWTDPYSNLSINVQSATASGLTLNLSYGAAPCTHANPTVILSPLNPSIPAGSSVNYSVSVINNDAAGCGASTYSLGSSQPSGWPTSFSSTSLTLNPGQTQSVTMSKTSLAGTIPGTYAVDTTAANGSLQGTGAANCTVTAPSPLSASVSIPASSYKRRQSVLIMAKATSGVFPASGASVKLILTKTDGSTVTKQMTADSTGTALWTYKLAPKDPVGSWSLSAQVSTGSQTATSNTVTFTVQ